MATITATTWARSGIHASLTFSIGKVKLVRDVHQRTEIAGLGVGVFHWLLSGGEGNRRVVGWSTLLEILGNVHKPALDQILLDPRLFLEDLGQVVFLALVGRDLRSGIS
jgi:hypothetical protein